MLGILRGFLPWILYSIFYGTNPDRFMLAIGVALISSVLVDWKELKAGFILTRCTFAYFALLLILAALFHWPWLQTNTWLISNCVLAAIALGSALIKKPFTMQYAKLEVAEQYWNGPLFKQINYTLTIMWGIIFLLTALVNYFYVQDPKLNGLSYMLLSNVGWFIGAYLNHWFPKYWKARYLKVKT